MDPKLAAGSANSSAISSVRAHPTAPAAHGSGFMLIGRTSGCTRISPADDPAYIAGLSVHSRSGRRVEHVGCVGRGEGREGHGRTGDDHGEPFQCGFGED